MADGEMVVWIGVTLEQLKEVFVGLCRLVYNWRG